MATQSPGSAIEVTERGIQPRDTDELMRLASKVAQSDLCPQSYRGKPADIILAWEHGAELGFSRLQSLNAIAVVNSRPCIYGDAGTALVMEKGLVDAYSEGFSGEEMSDEWTATVTMGRKGVKGEFVGVFSVADAKRAGLWGRATWKTYPRDMLLWRARWRAYKGGFADALRGLIFREVVEDYGDPRDVSDTVLPADAITPLLDRDSGVEDVPDPANPFTAVMQEDEGLFDE